MLADTWTGGGSSPILYCRVKNKKSVSGVIKNLKGKSVVINEVRPGIRWVERAFLEGKLPQSEVLAYQSVVRGLPERHETDQLFDD